MWDLCSVDPHGSCAVAVAPLALVGQGAGRCAVGFLLTVALMPEPLDPAYESVANPLGLPAVSPVEVPLLALKPPGRCLRAADRAGRCARVCAFAVPGGLHASSCAAGVCCRLASVGAVLVLVGTLGADQTFV